MTQTEIIAQNIIKYRKLKGFTQNDVAEYLGMTRSGYANYEHGIRSLSFETALKIGEYLGVSTDTLGYVESEIAEDQVKQPNANHSGGEELLREKICEKGTNLKSIATEISVPYSTLRDMQFNIGSARFDNVIKLCRYLGITVDELSSSSSAEFKITEFEKQVVIAYRNNPDMRAAVNKLLDVKEQSKVIELDSAARSDDGSTPAGKIAITEEQLNKIKNAPKIDDL